MQIQAPKGTKDVLPQESYKWQYVEGKIRELCRLYGIFTVGFVKITHPEQQHGVRIFGLERVVLFHQRCFTGSFCHLDSFV